MNTKKIIITVIAFIAMVNFAFAQGVDIKPGHHHSDPDAKKFAGTWEWKKGNDSLTLILSFQKIEYKMLSIKNVTSDAIVGWHKFVKNGKAIENSTPFKYSKYDKGKSTILSGTKSYDRNILYGTIQHTSKNKLVNFKIKYIDANRIKLIEVCNTSGLKLSTPDNPYDSSISLPQDIILTKKK